MSAHRLPGNIRTSVTLGLELGYNDPNPYQPGENSMDEETLRQMAITQYLQGKKPISIYQDWE